MVVIALMGKANSGKTSSLKFLMQNLLKVKGIEAKYLSRGYSPDTQACIDSISEKWNTATQRVSDVTLVAELDGKIICVTSYGDSFTTEVLPALERTVKKFGRCDIFVCGRHKNNDLTTEFSEYTPEIKIVEKGRDANFDKGNKATGAQLFAVVKSYL